jgi:hypothetical protein
MKVNTEKFKALLTSVSSITEKTKTTFTELIRISHNKGICKIESTSGDVMVVGKLRVIGGTGFECCVNAINLMTFIRPVKAEEIEIVLSGDVLQLIIGSVVHSLDSVSAEIMPPAPKFDKVAEYKDLKDFDRISHISSIPDTESNKPLCRVLYFSAKSEKTKDNPECMGDVVACDDIRIGRMLLHTGIDRPFAIPKKAGEVIASMNEKVDVVLGEKIVKFVCGKKNLIVYADIVPIDKYVNYVRKISSKYPYSIKFVKKSLQNAITQILISSDKDKSCIAFKVIDKETVTLRTFNSVKEIGSQATLTVTTDLPKGFLTGFKGRLLLETVNQCEEEYVTFLVRNDAKDRRFLMDTKDTAIIVMNINLIDGLNEIPKDTEEDKPIVETEENNIVNEPVATEEEPKEVIHKFGSDETVAEEIKQEDSPAEVKEKELEEITT